MTSSPGPMSSVHIAISSASVPEAQATACFTCEYRATSSSRPVISGPPMKWQLSMTRRTASSISARMVSYCARRSRSGTFTAVTFVGIFAAFSGRPGLRKGSGVDPALVLEQLFGGHAPPGARGLAHDDGAGRHVARHGGAGGDQAILVDGDAGQRHAAGADAPTLLHRHALEVLEALLRAADEVVVGGDHAGGHEHAVLEGRVRAQVALALELAVAAHGAEVLDGDATADDGAAAHGDVLAHGREVRDQ